MPTAHSAPTRSRAPRSRFERLYREHAPFVWAAARQCAPQAAVDDVVQDVFVTAYRRLDDLHAEISARGWLYGVTRKVAFRYRRSNARKVRRVAALTATHPGPTDPRPALEASEQLDALLAQLPPRQRELVVMSELLGMSGPEIAAQLGVPVNTAYSRVRAVRGRLESLAESAQTLDRALARQRAEARPSSRRVQRGWVALAPVVRSPWTMLTAGAKASSVLPSLGISVAIAATVLVVAVLARGVATDAAPSSSTSRTATKTDVPRAATPPSEAAPPRVHEPSRSASPDPPAADDPSTTVVAPRPRSRTRRVANSMPTPPPEDLEAELALLERAREAMAANRPDRALASLAEHARRFPHGALADARKATRVRALCARGDRAAARAEADRLRREHPGSALATSLANACDEPSKP